MYKFIAMLSILVLLFTACAIVKETEPSLDVSPSPVGFTDGQQKENEPKSIKENKTEPWAEFVSEDGKFKVDFPGEPQKSVEKIDWMDKKIPVTAYELVYRNILFRVDYADYPDSAVGSDADLEKIYDYKRDRLLALSKQRIVSEREINLGKHLGRELVVTDGKQFDSYCFYKIKTRSYTLVMSVKTKDKNYAKFKEVADYFFCTFDFLEE